MARSSRSSANEIGIDHPQISLAYLPPTPRQTRAALAGAAVLLLGLAVLIPSAAKPLPKVDGFIPALDAIISVTDLITAGLLLAHFSITRSRALWALACGYLFSAAIVVAHGLTFPGVISPTGNLGGSSHTNFRIYLLWHLGLPVALFAYVWLRDKDRTKAAARTTTEIVITVVGVGVLALVSCIAWLALLPPVDPVTGRLLTVITMMLCAAALSVLWVFRRSALDQWLMVVVVAMIVELAITALIGGFGPRIVTLGFYTGRLFSLVTSTVVLIALLAETSRLYANELSLREMTADLDRRVAQRTKELAEANEELQLQAGLLQNLPVSAWTLKPDGTPDFVNRVWLEVAGQTLDFVRSNPEAWMTAVHPEDRETVGKAFWDGISHGQGFAMEARTLCAQDGIYRWHLHQAVILRDAEEQALKFVGTSTDIDDQKRAEEEVRANELRLREMTADLDRRVAQRTKELAKANEELQLQAGLLQRLPVSTWTLNPDGTPDFVNQVWLEFSGQTIDFLRSHPEAWMTAVHPEDREAASKAFWGGVQAGQGFVFETRSLRAQDGAYRWHLNQAVVLRDAEGQVLKFIGTTTDIDDQKGAEEKLRESEHGSRLIVDSIPGLIAVLNASGEIERVSQPILDYFGRSLEELRQWAVDDTIHPDDRPEYLQAFERCFAAGDPFEFEVRTRRFDGVYRWFNMRGLPLRDRQEHIVRWYFLLTEVDDRKRAEEALRQAQGDLARINRLTTMGELAASLAHELSQPISGAITNANVCLRKLGHDTPDLDEVRTAVTRIRRDAQRAAEIIARIRSQFEKGAPKVQTLDVNEIIPETIALLRDEAVRYDIAVRTELAADLPQIVGDRVQLQQVAMNLIVNSIEAMKEVNGMREIVIQSQRAEDKQILVSFTDSGIGLPPQLAEQIFEPFFTTKTHGTGMGLRISRSIVESHGGRLWAESVAGRGATFHLSLPVSIPRS